MTNVIMTSVELSMLSPVLEALGVTAGLMLILWIFIHWGI